ncbi:hypothetical protein, partial [Thermoflexus sp.]|uniref:hypothetical protein n=1 Tax=Thermoflexus sp. TaxID=1969742 RepID=UPI0035E40175
MDRHITVPLTLVGGTVSGPLTVVWLDHTHAVEPLEPLDYTPGMTLTLPGPSVTLVKIPVTPNPSTRGYPMADTQRAQVTSVSSFLAEIPKAAWQRPIGLPVERPPRARTAYPIIDDSSFQGAPLGGLGAGTLARTYRGDFSRWHL